MTLPGQITAMILTYNEEPNIARTLDALGWVGEILIVDSGSTDATLAIAGRNPRVRIVTRAFDTFAGQCNFGLTQVTSPWVLSLDADYEISPALAAEIGALKLDSAISGYHASFVYRVYGKPLSASLYPPRTVLYRRIRARYHNEGHGHRVAIDGPVRPLSAPIFHDDRKSLPRWLASQAVYARREAEHLLATPTNQLDRADRIRRMAWPSPIAVFLYTLVWKRCLFDGWPGWLYALQRLLAETMIALELVDRRLRGTAKD